MNTTIKVRRIPRNNDGICNSATAVVVEYSRSILRIIMFMIALVLILQVKLLIKVNETTTTTTTTTTSATASNPLQPPLPQQFRQQQRKHPDRPPCPFENYTNLQSSIYIYPVPGSLRWNQQRNTILSEYAKSSPVNDYPWIAIDANNKRLGIGPYQPNGPLVQYSTELLVRDILTHPSSWCLRTEDPERARLFYVPYLPSTEFRNGTNFMGDFNGTSPYAKALMDVIVDGKYDLWETKFGFTSKYWKRREGSDHILVYSEPLHGLWHPRSKRGSYHYINSQYQLHPPIAISVELSTTFVDMYPNCARKNVLMPYPNTDGRWFNGVLDKEAIAVIDTMGIRRIMDSPAALPSEMQLLRNNHQIVMYGNSTIGLPRMMAQFYSAGNHGACRKLRKSMTGDFRCTPSGKLVMENDLKFYGYGYRLATFCPCPGGDSPSAKRMFDAILAGCIPVILSHDFVWPFTKEFDRSILSETSDAVVGSSVVLDPSEYSIRLNVPDHKFPKFDQETCNRVAPESQMDLQSVLEAIPPGEIARLREGGAMAASAYSYYQRKPSLPDNPLKEGVLPEGGAAHIFIRALEERVEGKLWRACKEEVAQRDPSLDRVKRFVC